MKGFKKDGKFIPTGKRNKSSLTKADLQSFETELDKGEQMLEQRERLKKQGASSIQHDKLILAQKKKLNKMAKDMKLKARNKETLGKRSVKDMMQVLREKGFKYKVTTEKDPYDDDDPEPVTQIDVEIPIDKVLIMIDGKRTSKDIIDELTGLTENERLDNNIDVDTHLDIIQDDGLATVNKETFIWTRIK